MDIVYLKKDRSTAVLLFAELLEPIDQALRDSLVSRVANRMAA